MSEDSFNSLFHCKKRYALLLVICCLFLLCNVAYAEVPEIMDYSRNLAGFCHTIAEINHEVGTANSIRGTSSQEYVVMCKTNGSVIDYMQTEPLTVIIGPQNRYIFTYSAWSDAQDAVNYLRKCHGILYAEHDSEIYASGTESTDTVSFRSQGAELIHLSGYLLLVQNYGSGSQTVAIIDSGVSRHSLLQSRLKTLGYDYIDADTDPTNDLSGHGTHVAGIIADCTVGTSVWIYPIRVLNKVGVGKMSNVVAAVLEATAADVDVINLSLESSEMSEALDDAIETAVANGTTVVIAAGNSSCDTSEVCPAHLTGEGIIVVGSAEVTDTGYSRSDYSNFGTSVDLYAFGSDIESCSRSGGYVVQSGTSMAAAHISGVCALMRLTHPGISPQETEMRLKHICIGTETPVPDIAGFVPISEGFYLSHILMDVGDTLRIPTCVRPSTSHAEIDWQSGNEEILSVDSEGVLHASGAGTTELVASCIGFDDVHISVDVYESGADGTVVLPADTTRIESEAFMGIGVKRITIPAGVECIGDRAFADCNQLQTIVFPERAIEIGQDILDGSEQAIVICSSDSTTEAYAVENELQYITIDE